MVFFGIIGFIVWMIVAAILNGWVLSVLWGWFFVPTFGLPELGVVQAIGIATVVGYLTYQYIDTQPKDSDVMGKLIDACSTSIVQSLFAVTFGWVVNLFM